MSQYNLYYLSETENLISLSALPSISLILVIVTLEALVALTGIVLLPHLLHLSFPEHFTYWIRHLRISHLLLHTIRTAFLRVWLHIRSCSRHVVVFIWRLSRLMMPRQVLMVVDWRVQVLLLVLVLRYLGLATWCLGDPSFASLHPILILQLWLPWSRLLRLRPHYLTRNPIRKLRTYLVHRASMVQILSCCW